MAMHPLYENDPTDEVSSPSNFQSSREANRYDQFREGSRMNDGDLGGPPKLPPRESGYSSRVGATEYSNDDDQDLYLTPVHKIEPVVHRPSYNIPRRTTKKKKRVSHYDQDNYALPDSTSSASSQGEDSDSGDTNILCKFWTRAYSKRGALIATFIISLLCIVVVISVAISSSSDDKGKHN